MGKSPLPACVRSDKGIPAFPHDEPGLFHTAFAVQSEKGALVADNVPNPFKLLGMALDPSSRRASFLQRGGPALNTSRGLPRMAWRCW